MPLDQDLLTALELRLGRLHARQRLGIETDHEARVLGLGLNFFSFETLYSMPGFISTVLKLCGLYGRGRRNADNVLVRQNEVRSKRLPAEFDGFTLLHMTDLHVDISQGAMRSVIERLAGLQYDLCVLTGDYRGKTFGPFQPALEGMAQICRHLNGPVYGVLGNHDTVRMIPGLEAMGIKMLFNECQAITRDGQTIHLAGVDDPHYFRLDNIEKAGSAIPEDGFSILLAHSPEVYRQAAYAGFDLMLSGHTHGGQICLPGSIPVTLDAVLPRRLGAGAWRYQEMAGYTSVGAGTCIVPVRLNCPPEIVLHRLRRG
jgi:hypothetical protein